MKLEELIELGDGQQVLSTDRTQTQRLGASTQKNGVRT